MSALNKIPLMFKTRFMRYGLPFLFLVVGGSFGLKEFAQLRYTFAKKQKLTRNDVESLGLELKPEGNVTIETTYEEIQQMDIDNWKNIRGPRPWEEPSPELEAMRNKSKKL